MLRLAASLADGIPADLRDAFTGMDTAKLCVPPRQGWTRRRHS